MKRGSSMVMVLTLQVLPAEAASEGFLKLDLGLMIWTWISFLLVLYLLGRYAYRPMLFLVQQREKRIQESLAKAEDAKQRAEAALEERERMLRSAQEDARKVVDAARQASEAQRRRILDEAQQDVARMTKHAEEEIERERRHAMAELAGTVADLAVEAASRILHEELDHDKHLHLIDRVIQDMESQGG